MKGFGAGGLKSASSAAPTGNGPAGVMAATRRP